MQLKTRPENLQIVPFITNNKDILFTIKGKRNHLYSSKIITLKFHALSKVISRIQNMAWVCNTHNVETGLFCLFILAVLYVFFHQNKYVK